MQSWVIIYLFQCHSVIISLKPAIYNSFYQNYHWYLFHTTALGKASLIIRTKMIVLSIFSNFACKITTFLRSSEHTFDCYRLWCHELFAKISKINSSILVSDGPNSPCITSFDALVEKFWLVNISINRKSASSSMDTCGIFGVVKIAGD